MKKPKIMVWDIEVAGVQGLQADRGYMVMFGYKWLGSKEKPKVMTILDYPNERGLSHAAHHGEADFKLLRAAHEVMSEADLIVAHYGDKFDRPYIETRLMLAGLQPFPMVRQIDTCLIARARLRLSSNRLENLARYLGCENNKLEKDWPGWWMGALRGCKKCIAAMKAYNVGDVLCLEDVVTKMMPMIPERYLYNMSLHTGGMQSCPSCGGKIKWNGSYYTSPTRRYRKGWCRNCGRPVHERKAVDKAP